MTSELRGYNPSQTLFLQALSSAWRNGTQLHDPSVWQREDPEVEEKMLRDAGIAHALSMRRHMIAGKDWHVTPLMESSPAAPVAVSVATELLKGIKHFSQARLNLARAFFSGSRFAKIHHTPRVLTIGDGVPRTWWVPTRIEDLDKRMFRIVPSYDDQSEQLSATWEMWDVGSAQWKQQTVGDALATIRHVYQDDQATIGHGRALREAIGWWWHAKANVFAESLQAVERFAQGVISAKVDGVRDAASNRPNQELIREWRAVLEDMRARHVLVYDKSDQIEMIKMDGQGWQLLAEIREELRMTITTLILGASLPTSGGGDGGSYALGGIQQDSTEILIQFDRETLEETLSDDLIGWMWKVNRFNLLELGIADEKPRFSITQEKRQDPQDRATVAQTLNSMGVELSLEDVLEQTGFRKPDIGEPTIEGNVASALPPMMPPGMFKR